MDVLGPEKKNLQKWKRKREKDYVRNNCEEAKKRRHGSKAVKDQLMMKEDAKKRHSSGKVSVKKSAKVGKPRKVLTCGVCHQQGHNRTPCPMPPLEKGTPKANLLDWNKGTTVNTRKSKAKQYQAKLIDWSA